MRKVFIPIPDFSRHGGIRVIIEWANRLAKRHVVFLRPLNGRKTNGFAVSSRVKIVEDDAALARSDLLIITSPHSIHYAEERKAPSNVAIFLQMAEHMFRPMDAAWQERCFALYRSPHRLILISRWNEDLIRQFGREGPTHYVGNGVNLRHFPISEQPKDGRAILVEGWDPGNPTKDVDRLGARVALRLKKESGVKVLAYGSGPPLGYLEAIDEYHVKPTLNQLNDVYERATILIKASKYDARSCSPMEAMTKGTVTARALDKGDDDLVHGVNCLRGPYDHDQLYRNAKELLRDSHLRNCLANNARAHVREFTWEYWMTEIEKILWNKET